MKKNYCIACFIFVIVFGCLMGCGKSATLEDGIYNVQTSLEGGTGKASVNSPATVVVKDGQATATIVWTSKKYDYMIVNDVKYENEAEAGEYSTFTFPIDGVPCDMDVIGDTTAMSVPHEIEYTLHFEHVDEN